MAAPKLRFQTASPYPRLTNPAREAYNPARAIPFLPAVFRQTRCQTSLPANPSGFPKPQFEGTSP
ncbi:hypothetical protein HMPREF9123_2725 [Neisseria bacilliformis ATCC BAA-1200]|uniref:Uncharacterized protein n=1 Tax=Neisseria bacilliformis ATCC BAA-1200 TaxID=888742 RepID=F2BG68_9NEIS|nr:hypothetical protein HMPREF9123_2725 [Neisseria bacilliformis ATCC BAA-1200]